MATFTEIYYNGNEYKQIWLNGSKVWEKDSGEEEQSYLIDFTQPTAPEMPIWFTEETVNRGNFLQHVHKLCDDDFYDDFYGLTAQGSINWSKNGAWSCYKVVSPATGTLNILFRVNGLSSSTPFRIYLTSSIPSTYDDLVSNTPLIQVTESYRVYDKIVTLNLTKGETYYIHFVHGLIYYSCIRSISLVSPIKSITGFTTDVDLDNVNQQYFTVIPIIKPNNYDIKDLEVVYDSTYMTINTETNEVSLKDGCQGKTLSITYRSKADNSISNTLTFTVSQDIVIEEPKFIDFTTSTAPTLPSYMTVDGQGSSYYFSHSTYTTDVYGLVPNNSGKYSSTAYTRYKYVAPEDGALTFTYRCSSESSYDYLTVHVNNSTSQPSYSSSNNRLVYNSGTTYQTTDGTASVNVTSGTTYYIHIQYYKDSSGDSACDKGCIRRIELL